ncbi:MAG: ABC transporter permease [Steroidobacteraceae bacterium]
MILNRVVAIAIKEVRQLRRDRLTFGMIIGIPLLQMLMFGYAINFDVRGLHAAVLDEAQTSASRDLVGRLQATGVIRITSMPPSIDVLQAELDRGDITVGIHIPTDFERRLLRREYPVAQILVDGSKPSLENIARGMAMLPAPSRPGDYREAPRFFEVRTEYNPEKRTAVQIVPALTGVILNMTMMIFTAVAIVRERERGNLELLITTPASGLELLCGKLLPYVVIGLIQTTLVLALGSWLFQVPIVGSLLDVYLASLLFIASTLMLGLLLSTLAKTQMQAFQMAFFLMLPSILLSGFMFPFEGMPRAAQWIAQLLPLTHFNDLIRGLILRGAPFRDLAAQAWKLALFLFVTLILAAMRFRKRLD